MAVLLTSSTCDEVRAVLDLALDATALPDATIELPIFIDRAEADILAADPNATTYTVGSTERNRAERALAYFTASYLAPSLPQITQEQVGSDRYSRERWDAGQQAARLRGLGNTELAANLTTDGLISPLFSFGRACGRRGF